MFKTIAFVLLLTVVSLPASAHGQHGHATGGHGGGHASRPYHQGSNWGHSNWSHVVPSQSHYGNSHQGSYYSTGQNHYYTPTAVTYSTAMNYSAPPPQAPVQLGFGGFTHTEDLSGRLETDVNNFCLDLHYNYQNNPNFAEVYREAYGILQATKYVHAKEHQGDRAEMARQVQDIDQKLHHIQQEVLTLQRQPSRQIGVGEAVTKAQNMEAVLHHLAYNVGVQPHSAQAQNVQSPMGGAAEVAPPPPGGAGQSPPPPGVPGRI